jgi:predicted nucleic acid-binding Zn ribbon protein
MFCPVCRTKVEGDARYCPKCGKLLTSKSPERAVNNIYLVVAALGVTLSINIPLVSFVLRITPKTEPFAYFFAYDLSPFLIGVLFGLAVLLILEFLGNFFKPFDKDWSLIMAWGRAWANWNIPLGLLLSVVLAWWWIFATAILFVGVTWGAAFMLAASILLSPIIGLANWLLSWVYAFFNSIASRFFVVVPYFPTEKDREKVKELFKNVYDRLKGSQSDES